MKVLDNIVNAIGADKIMHFLVAALLVALLSPLGWIAMGITTIVVLSLEFIKEQFLDDEFSIEDLYYTIAGCAFTLIINLFYLL